jgi:hypothetical protein
MSILQRGVVVVDADADDAPNVMQTITISMTTVSVALVGRVLTIEM